MLPVRLERSERIGDAHCGRGGGQVLSHIAGAMGVGITFMQDNLAICISVENAIVSGSFF